MTKDEVIEVLQDLAFEAEGFDDRMIMLDTVIKYVNKIDEAFTVFRPGVYPCIAPDTVPKVDSGIDQYNTAGKVYTDRTIIT